MARIAPTLEFEEIDDLPEWSIPQQTSVPGGKNAAKGSASGYQTGQTSSSAADGDVAVGWGAGLQSVDEDHDETVNWAADGASSAGVAGKQVEKDWKDDVWQDSMAVAEAKRKALQEQADQTSRVLKEMQAKDEELEAELERIQKSKQIAKLDIEKLKAKQKKLDDIKEKRDADSKAARKKGGVLDELLSKQAGNKTEDKEAERKRRREENRRRALEMGAELLEDEDDVTSALGRFMPKRGAKLILWVHSLSLRLQRRLLRYDPFVSRVAIVNGRFGPGFAAYFAFLRWMIIQCFLVGSIWLAFLVYHALGFSSFSTLFSLRSFWPILALVSSFDSPRLYTYLTLLTVVVISISSVSKLSTELASRLRAQIRDSTESKGAISLLILSSWDFSVEGQQEVEVLQESIVQQYRVMKSEEEKAVGQALLSKTEKFLLYSRRTFGIFLNLLLLLLGWSAIIYVTFFFSSSSGSSTISALLPSIVPSVVNAALPQVTSFCVKFEKWTLQATELKITVFRLYLAKILVALVQLAIVFIFLNGPPSGLFRIEKRNCNFTLCEDQAGTKLFILFITDIIVSSVAALSLPNALATVAKIRSKAPEPQDFEIAKMVIKILYQQILLWLCIPFFPFASIVGGFALAVVFFTDFRVLVKHCKKPLKPWSARDTMAFFSVLFNVTWIFGILSFMFVLFIHYNNNADAACCGSDVQSDCLADASTTSCPLEGVMFEDKPPMDVFSEWISSSSVTSWLEELYAYPRVAWVSAVILLVAAMWQNAMAQLYERFMHAKRQTLSMTIQTLDRVAKRQQRIIDVRRNR